MLACEKIGIDSVFFYPYTVGFILGELAGDKEDRTTNLIFRSVPECDTLINSLPYELTNDQKKVWEEIKADLQGKKLMNRLVQGDVGSGKTIVAFIASYANYLSNYQTAIMAPTEILAKQHYEGAKKLFKNYEIKVELTPYQQKVENEINEFLHAPITWKSLKEAALSEVPITFRGKRVF